MPIYMMYIKQYCNNVSIEILSYNDFILPLNVSIGD